MKQISLAAMREIAKMEDALNYLAGTGDGELYAPIVNQPVMYEDQVIGYLNLGTEPDDATWFFSFREVDYGANKNHS